MGAKKTGGTASRRSARDKEMAAYMKAKGIKRSTFRCPICNGMVAIDRAYAHLAFHGGGSKE